MVEVPPQRPGRTIVGISAVLLPFDATGAIAWSAYERLLERTVAAGLTPAVNMDTGFVHLIDAAQRAEVLRRAALVAPSGFVGGAYVADAAGAPFDLDAHRRAAGEVAETGGTPIVFPSHGLTALADADLADAHRAIGAGLDAFYAFELGRMFNPAGRIFSLDVVSALMAIPACVGLKHSSLDRTQEWARLVRRDAERPDFRVCTGNDLAIDMVCWGSDYLLGLSAFCPDLFARRDAWWAASDPRFHELNDALQAIGAFAFRAPVPGYRDDAARVLRLRGWLTEETGHPAAPTRPAADDAVLTALLARAEEVAAR